MSEKDSSQFDRTEQDKARDALLDPSSWQLLGPVTPGESEVLFRMRTAEGNNGLRELAPDNEEERKLIKRIGATGANGEIIVVVGDEQLPARLLDGSALDFGTRIDLEHLKSQNPDLTFPSPDEVLDRLNNQ